MKGCRAHLSEKGSQLHPLRRRGLSRMRCPNMSDAGDVDQLADQCGNQHRESASQHYPQCGSG